MQPPQPLGPASLGARLRNRGGIHHPDQAALRRRGLLGLERLADKAGEPGLHVAQPAQQRDVGHVRQTKGCAPSRGEPQAHLTQAVGQGEAQEINGAADFARAQKGARETGARLQGLGSAEASDDGVPVISHKR